MAAIPMFLGSDEVSGMFLGADELQEMYLGTDLVYQSGPFVGIKITPKTVQFFSTSLTASIKVKASEQWSLTTPAWLSASVSTGDTGETIVTLTATAQTATTTDTITVTSANYSASATATYYVWQELAYIQNGPQNNTKNRDFTINIGYVPTTATTVEITLAAGGNDGNSILTTDYTGGNDWWRFFTYMNYAYVFDCPTDSDARVQGNATITNTNVVKCWAVEDNGGTIAYIQVNGGTPTSNRTSKSYNVTGPLKLWSSYNRGSLFECIQGTKIYGIKIWEGQTLAMDLKPAKLGTTIGLFDTVGGAMYQNSGSGTLLYGELSQ